MASAPLELRLLGEFTLIRDAREVASPPWKNARILIARLALRPGHEFVRDELAARLWPDSDQDAARFNLRQLIARIRRAAPDLSPFIVPGERTTLRLDTAGLIVDAVEFKRLAAHAPGRAIAHHHGRLLDGIDDPWVNGVRADIEELYIDTLARLADDAEPRAAVSWLRRAVAAAPYREPMQQRLMTRLSECGDTNGMQVAFREFKDALHRQFNLAPSDETNTLYERLLTDPPGVAPAAPTRPLRSRLPVPASAIIGREEDILRVRGLLEEQRAVTLIGPGGVGKTRLAIAVGSEELAGRSEGVWFVDLTAIRDRGRVAHAIAQAMGLHNSPSRPWLEVLADGLSESDRLLILDNCEQVVDECAEALEHLLLHCPGLRVLATSRVRIGLKEEQRFEVLPLGFPPTGGVDLRSFPALRLFEARARLASPTFELTPTNVQTVAHICDEVDGLPLGIEMACARLNSLSLEELSARLDNKLRFLKSPSRTSPARHRSLEQVIQWSFDLLAEDTRALFRRLSIFVGGSSLAAAEAVCGFGSISAFEVVDGVVALVDASLLERRGDRYRFLETVRQFGRDRLAEAGEWEAIHNRHLDWFLALSEESQAKLQGHEQTTWYARLDEELGNFRSALEWGLERTPESALRMCGALWRFWQSRGFFTEGREWSMRALAAAAEADAVVRGNVLNGIGTLARDQSDYSAATAAHTQALHLFRSVDDRAGAATSMIGLGIVQMHTGDYEGAWNSCQACLEIRRALGDSWGVASALNNLGLVAMNRGDNCSALQLHREAMELSRGAGDLFALARSLTNMGRLEMAGGELGMAREHHDESTAIRRELGDRSGLARSLCQLGLVATLQGDLSVSGASHAESLAIGRDIGDRRCMAENLESIGQLEFRRDHWKQGLKLWAAAERLREWIGAPLPPTERVTHDLALVEARSHVSESEFTESWAGGRAMSLERAATVARQSLESG